MTLADPAVVRRHLDKVLASAALGKAETSRKLLTYLVERALRAEAPKELEIAIDVFGRDAKFHSAEDSLVRVGVRTLRQKLIEYYADEGRQDDLHFVIPKGGYRLTTEPPPATPSETSSAEVESRSALDRSSTTLALAAPSDVTPAAIPEPPARTPQRSALKWLTAVAIVLLAASVFANVYWWNRSAPLDPTETRVRQSPVWADIYASQRTLTIVLGDLFMYTQVDPTTGRTLTVRDSEINSSEELRQFLASNPSLSAERGQRYATLIPKSAAVGMAAILPIVARPGRRVEVRILDELQVDDIRNNDIIFIGAAGANGPAGRPLPACDRSIATTPRRRASRTRPRTRRSCRKEHWGTSARTMVSRRNSLVPAATTS